MSLKLVIFDVDGLLLDTEKVWQEVWIDVAQRFSLPISGSDLFRKVIGISGSQVNELLREPLEKYCSPDEFLNIARNEGVSRLKTELHLKPGVFDILNYLKERNVCCAVATSTCRALTDERLRKVGIYDYFDLICCGDEIKNRKPSPDIYLEIIKRLNVTKENVLIFEDSPIGVQAAINAEIGCVIVPDIIQPNRNLCEKAVRVIKSLEDAKGVIEQYV